MKNNITELKLLLYITDYYQCFRRTSVARIMVVEDTIFIRTKIRDSVIEGGHVVVGEAENGLQAVNIYSKLQPDIVTMDITMPLMGGIEALKQIIKINPKAKVIMLSAMGQQMIVLDCIKLGAKHFIVKPLCTSDLLRVIDEVLENVPIIPKVAAVAEIKTSITAFDTLKTHIVTGTFIIEFLEPFNLKSIEDFSKVIEEILKIKPLNIVIDYKDIEFISYPNLKEIDKILSTVRDIGGNVVIYSRNNKFIGFIHSMKLNQFNNVKTDY